MATIDVPFFIKTTFLKNIWTAFCIKFFNQICTYFDGTVSTIISVIVMVSTEWFKHLHLKRTPKIFNLRLVFNNL